MNLYKKGRNKNILEYFANNIIEHSINSEEINIPISVSEAIICLQKGINPLRSCQIIKNEIMNANFSCQSLFDSGVIRYILPYININTELELLNDSMIIIDKCTLDEQPSDSPLQNEIFLKNIIMIFQLQYKAEIKTLALNTILNLLHDDNIFENIFLILKKLDILKILQKCDFFNPDYTNRLSYNNEIENPLFYTSELLSDFSRMYQREELICMVEFIPLLSQGLINENIKAVCRQNYGDALAHILKNTDTHRYAFESKVPENCVKSLTLYHDQSVTKVFDCIYQLIIHHDIEEFQKPVFIRLCTHLLMTPNDKNMIVHILRVVDVYLQKYFTPQIFQIFESILIDLTLSLDMSFEPRIAASIILIRFISNSNDAYINDLLQKHFFSFVFNNIFSYEKDDIIYIIKIILEMFERKNEIKKYFMNDSDFQQMMVEISENDDNEISQLTHFFDQFQNEN